MLRSLRGQPTIQSALTAPSTATSCSASKCCSSAAIAQSALQAKAPFNAPNSLECATELTAFPALQTPLTAPCENSGACFLNSTRGLLSNAFGKLLNITEAPCSATSRAAVLLAWGWMWRRYVMCGGGVDALQSCSGVGLHSQCHAPNAQLRVQAYSADARRMGTVPTPLHIHKSTGTCNHSERKCAVSCARRNQSTPCGCCYLLEFTAAPGAPATRTSAVI